MRFITAFVLSGIFTVLTIPLLPNQTPFPQNRGSILTQSPAFNPVSASPAQKVIMMGAPI